MIFDKNNASAPAEQRWVNGDMFGLDIPADAATLLSNGPDFLTHAFRSAGTMSAENKVKQIVHLEEFIGGGTGKKCVLKVEYERQEPGLHENLFIKFSRNFDNELWDRARSLMVAEARFAILSRGPDFPVAVPFCLFADVNAESGSGLIITENIPYGSNGVEPLYPKCLDYTVPEPLEHYKAILKGLARLSGAHRSGHLAKEFDEYFPFKPKQAAGMFAIRTPLDKLTQRANRMFDFVTDHPQLFPDNVRDPAFHQQFIKDIPDVVAAESGIMRALFDDPNMFAFAHWNANIDNCWFWRDEEKQLQCGFLDWANAGQISMAQSINGAISGAEPAIWTEHLDELLTTFVDEYAKNGGPRLDIAELRQQVLLIVAVSGLSYAMGAPIAVERDIADIKSVKSYQDDCFKQFENARIQLHMMTKMLNLWQTRQLGDVIRALPT